MVIAAAYHAPRLDADVAPHDGNGSGRREQCKRLRTIVAERPDHELVKELVREVRGGVNGDVDQLLELSRWYLRVTGHEGKAGGDARLLSLAIDAVEQKAQIDRALTEVDDPPSQEILRSLATMSQALQARMQDMLEMFPAPDGNGHGQIGRNGRKLRWKPNLKEGEDVDAMWRAYKGDQSSTSLRNKLIEVYLPLVTYNAERIWSRLPDGVELDDLVSAGVFGLMDAIESFDLSRGVKFETYCVPRIRGAMLDELRVMDWVPRLVRKKANKIAEARKELETELGRTSTDEEMAKHMGLSLQDFEAMQIEADATHTISLEKKWYETDSYKDVREVDILSDRRAESPDHRAKKQDLLHLTTKGLNRNERLIMILYYWEELTMKEIGATLDLSESRVSQMHSAIIQRLQFSLRSRRSEFSL